MIRVREATALLPPGSFAFVMATGIVSIGMAQQDLRTLSLLLLVIAGAAWLILLVALTLRLLLYRERVIADLHDPRRAFGFFTFVAGTDVLAVRLAEEHHHVSVALLAFATVVGLVLGYAVPWAAVLSRTHRPVLSDANGTWFIWVVASQSVATAAATIEPAVTVGRAELAVLAVAAWSVGIVLYAACAVMVALRLMLYPLTPSDLDPPYWVSMGAIAITVVAGASIVDMESTPMVESVRGLIAGLSVVFWCIATWLIPVLTAAGWWRHKIRGVPLRYQPTLWSIIFPLGMYAVASISLGRADRLPIVESIGDWWLWVALAAWTVVAVAMLHHVFRTVVLPARR